MTPRQYLMQLEIGQSVDVRATLATLRNLTSRLLYDHRRKFVWERIAGTELVRVTRVDYETLRKPQ